MEKGRCPAHLRISKVFLCSLLLLSLLPAATGSHEPPCEAAILGAFNEEVRLLLEEIQGASEETVQGVKFVCGKLRGKNVVVGLTGVGKVNAAMATALLIERFDPEVVLFTGVSGCLNSTLLPGDIVVGATTVQHDLGAWTDQGMRRHGVRNPLTGERNPTGIPGDPRLLELAGGVMDEVRLSPVSIEGASTVPKTILGTIVSGDVFLASKAKKRELVDDLGADAVEMEGAAVAQVCWQLGVPCLIVRSVSDRAESDAEDEFERYYRTAAGNAAAFVLGLIEQFSAGERGVDTQHGVETPR